MNRRILLTICCSLQLCVFGQTYNFNRQSIMRFDNEHKSHIDIWTTPITIDIQKQYIILRRPPAGAGEKAYIDTLIIKSTSHERRDKRDNFKKITVTDGRVFVIYGDDYITMATKETRDHKRTEYVFYNQKAE